MLNCVSQDALYWDVGIKIHFAKGTVKHKLLQIKIIVTYKWSNFWHKTVLMVFFNNESNMKWEYQIQDELKTT